MGVIQSALNSAMSGTAFLLNQSGALDEPKARTQTKKELSVLQAETSAQEAAIAARTGNNSLGRLAESFAGSEVEDYTEKRAQEIMEKSGSAYYRTQAATRAGLQKAEFYLDAVTEAAEEQLRIQDKYKASLAQRVAAKEQTKKAKDPYKRPVDTTDWDAQLKKEVND